MPYPALDAPVGGATVPACSISTPEDTREMKARIVLAGGTGFLGTRLAEELLVRGYDVVILTRSERRSSSRVRFRQWDGKTAGEWEVELDGAAAVVNFAGRTVNCRHTKKNKREIIESRVHSVEAIGKAAESCASPPPVWVQAASLAIYGDTGNQPVNEQSPIGEGFPAETCVLWESAFHAAKPAGTRGVLLRIGIVLDPGRGALAVLERLVRMYLGGAAGNGAQYISWIHWRDLNAIFLAAIEQTDLASVFNATGPNPVTNAELMRQLRSALHRPWCPPAPGFMVHLGAALLGTEPKLVLGSCRAVPARLLEKGFRFEFPELEAAITNLYRAS